MNKSVLIEFFGNNPLIRIMDFLIENKGLDYSKQEIAEGAKISRTTLYKFWDKIEKMSLVKETRRFANARLFVLDEENLIVKRILRLELDLIRYYAEIDTSGITKDVRTPITVSNIPKLANKIPLPTKTV